MTDLSYEADKAWTDCQIIYDLSFKSVNMLDVVQINWKTIWDFVF